MPNVHVSLAHRSYDIAIGHGLLAETSARCLEWCGLDAPGSALVVTDAHLADSHAATVAAGFEADGWLMNRHVLEPGEPSKSLASAESMFDSLVALPADRGTLVVAVGGGVVGDAAGFVAATYARGIRFVQVPTTLLAQVDSSVGGKVAVNHPRAKNLIGAFHQPAGVLIDTATLETLPERDYRSGLAEVIKYGVILDAEFFDYLEQHAEGLDGRDREVLAHVIARSCELKAEVVEQDERETTGVRAVLNYGHTFAHAYEALAGYGELLHGEAVAIGMIQASRLAEQLGRIDSATTDRQVRLLEQLGLPVSPPTEHDTGDILARMRLDKKTTGGRLRFVLPSRMGHVELVDDVPEELVRELI